MDLFDLFFFYGALRNVAKFDGAVVKHERKLRRRCSQNLLVCITGIYTSLFLHRFSFVKICGIRYLVLKYPASWFWVELSCAIAFSILANFL